MCRHCEVLSSWEHVKKSEVWVINPPDSLASSLMEPLVQMQQSQELFIWLQWCMWSLISAAPVTYYLFINYTPFFSSFAQVSFSDQTPYFIGRNLQSAAHPVEMMKWSWSTMKVTFGRWTAFIFITGVPVLGSFDKTWNASPAHGFCDKRCGSAPRRGSWCRLCASARLLIVIKSRLRVSSNSS